MTGRERLEAILHKRPADGLSWTTLVDSNTLDLLPGEMKGMSGIDFYRHIGCDILMLNAWGTEHRFLSPTLEWPEGVVETVAQEGDRRRQEIRSPAGTLVRERHLGHPVRFPVTTLEKVRVYRTLWEGARFLARDDSPPFQKVNRLIGDDGVVTRFWGPSTIPKLLEQDMGTEAFYYLLHDHREEMEGLISAIHEKELEAFRILAQGPCDVVILIENTSTFYISPEVYRRYNGPHVRDFVDIVHQAGKTAIIHMCGHVRNILGLIKETGLDGIHALTPSPTGDTPWELAMDLLGDDQIIIGILDPSIFVSGPLEEIPLALDELYTPRLRRANFCLWPAADGIVVPLERFQAVAAWMERNGGRG